MSGRRVRKDDVGARIAAGIVACRERVGHTQTSLARALGIAQSHLSHWESSSRTPTPVNLWRIADKLSVTLDELCGRTQPPDQSIRDLPTLALLRELIRRIEAGETRLGGRRRKER